MMGSGTVVALAQSRNHRAIGIDIDPLAGLIAKVWTTPVRDEAARSSIKRTLRQAEKLAKRTLASESFPTSDPETRQFIRYWFDCQARRQLMGLATAISREKDTSIRNLLWCAFSRIIIAKQGASRALDLVHSRPHRHFIKAPVLPFSKFEAAAIQVLSNTPGKRLPSAKVRIGDARKTKIRSSSIDLVLTSPPYLNAIDYMRCSKFSLVWMGYNVAQIRSLRAASVGSEVGLSDETQIRSYLKTLNLARLPKRKRALVSAYIAAMLDAVREVSRVLVPGGRAVYVVGENVVSGVYVRNSKILRMLAKGFGLKFERSVRRALPPNRRYMPPPTKRQESLDSRMRSEIILQFRKTTARQTRY